MKSHGRKIGVIRVILSSEHAGLGFAEISAPVLIAAMGRPGRFRDGTRFKSYAGLAPRASETGGLCQRARTTSAEQAMTSGITGNHLTCQLPQGIKSGRGYSWSSSSEARSPAQGGRALIIRPSLGLCPPTSPRCMPSTAERPTCRNVPGQTR
jgi:hypothetical protein